jgi:hypothetical protein
MLRRLTVCSLLLASPIFAASVPPITIDFENQPAGPCCFASAGPAQTLTYNVSGTTVKFTGGVILTGESNQTTDNSNVYATASFGNGLSSALQIQFGVPVQNFRMDILNALAGTYTLSDNAGHSQNFSLATTGGSLATEQFNTAGTILTLAYDGPGVSGITFDYAIDNLTATPSTCAAIVAGAVSVGTANGGATATAAFTPNNGLTLSQAATQCGFSSFNWQQVVTVDPYPPNSANGTPQTPPYLDPPVGGYQGGPADNAFPFYWNPSELAGGSCSIGGSAVTIQTASTLTFCDTPAEPKLKTGEFLAFETTLLGIDSSGGTTPLFDFDWTSNFKGTVQLGSARGNPNAPDPNSGTGGVTITEVNGIPFVPTAVPEPATGLLTIPALLLAVLYRKRGRLAGAGSRER